MKKVLLWIAALVFISHPLSSQEEATKDVWIIPPEVQESLGESTFPEEMKPWIAGAAGTASGLLFVFGYRSLSGALESAQQMRPPGEIHGQAFSGAAMVFIGASLGILIKDLLWPPDPPEIISEE